MKAFNVRVAMIEPGVIATPIFSEAKPLPKDSPYPHLRRLRAMFAASLTNPTSAYVVGEQIRQIVDSDSWQLRYPVGPDAVPFMKWRAGKTDEEWSISQGPSMRNTKQGSSGNLVWTSISDGVIRRKDRSQRRLPGHYRGHHMPVSAKLAEKVGIAISMS
jgi:hypothetical protein